MDRETAIEQLKSCQAPDGDEEYAHGEADKILCELLNSLGYQDVVEEWVKVPKWYA